MKPGIQLAATQPEQPSRREFLKWSGTLGVGSALAGVVIPAVHATEDNTIRLALIGCGGRGSGAVGGAMDSPHGPVKLTAMADLFPKRLEPGRTGSTRFGFAIVYPGLRHGRGPRRRNDGSPANGANGFASLNQYAADEADQFAPRWCRCGPEKGASSYHWNSHDTHTQSVWFSSLILTVAGCAGSALAACRSG